MKFSVSDLTEDVLQEFGIDIDLADEVPWSSQLQYAEERKRYAPLKFNNATEEEKQDMIRRDNKPKETKFEWWLRLPRYKKFLIQLVALTCSFYIILGAIL